MEMRAIPLLSSVYILLATPLLRGAHTVVHVLWE